MKLDVLEESADAGELYWLLLAVTGYSAFSILSPEAGLQVFEIPEEEGKSFRRQTVRVRVVSQPDQPPDPSEGLKRQAIRIPDACATGSLVIVRRYRDKPSPLVRDSVRAGARDGSIEFWMGISISSKATHHPGCTGLTENPDMRPSATRRRIGGTKSHFQVKARLVKFGEMGHMSTRRPWKVRTAPTTAILGQPGAMRQESWHTSPSGSNLDCPPSSSVQNIIGSSMGPFGEGLAIGDALTGRPEGDATAQMIVVVCVAARAMQRTLAGDFNRQQQTVAVQQPSPRRHDRAQP
jgi:hypothetical protein